MKASCLLVVLCLVAASLAQRIDRIIVDDYSSGTNSIVITIPENPNFPIVDSDIFTDTSASNLLGGERDLELTVENGPSNRILVSQVNGGEWNTATPNSASGFAVMQWDGTDNDAANLNPTGLGGIDLTDTGLADEFHAIIETDIDTSYTFTVLSQDGSECSRTVEIPGDDTPQDYFLGFSTFTQGCDFSDVGAIEILVEAFDNVDSIIYLFAVSGEDDPSPSNTPAPSPSNSPGVTPSPAPSPEECVCMCPIFTCGLIYAQPGDDDDTVDDDTHDDDDLIFRPVYYGPGDDDFDNVIPDDDENEFFSFEGGLSVDANDDDDVTTNSSSVLAVPVLLVSALVLAF